MKVAVVTPYYETPIDWLGQCHRSVKAQTHPCTHFLVSDGKPEEVVEHYDAHHVRLPGPHRDVGNTGRAIGAILAQRQGFDAICFLDADNWYRPDHVASLVALQRRTGAAVCSSSRMIHHLDGALLGACKEVDGEVFVDTNCLLLTRPAFRTIAIWYEMDPRLHPIGDRVVWHQIKRMGLSTAYSGETSVSYRSSYHVHYRQFGIEPPAGAKVGTDVRPAQELLNRLLAEDKENRLPLPLESLDQMLDRPPPRPGFVLVSLIGLPESQWPRVIEAVNGESEADGLLPVFLIDRLTLEPFVKDRLLVEHVPGAAMRDRMAPDLDWDLYLARRLRFLQQKWQTSRLVAFGLPIEAVFGKSDAAA
jgi:hypothetical protein